MIFDTRPKVQVHIAQTNESFPCAGDESLLKGMLRLGRKGIPVGCVNGGCGVCKVKILEGSTTTLGPVSRAHVSAEEEAQGGDPQHHFDREERRDAHLASVDPQRRVERVLDDQ